MNRPEYDSEEVIIPLPSSMSKCNTWGGRLQAGILDGYGERILAIGA